MLERIWGYPIDKLKKYYNFATTLQIIVYVIDIAIMFFCVYLLYESDSGGGGYIKCLLGVCLVFWIIVSCICGNRYKAYKVYRKVKSEDLKCLRVVWGTPLRNSLKREFGAIVSSDFVEAVNFVASVATKREMSRLHDILVEHASVEASYIVYYVKIKNNVYVLDAQIKEVSNDGENSSDDEGTDSESN